MCHSPETCSAAQDFIKLSVDFILKVYVRIKARLCVLVNFFRFVKPCVCQNLHKNPFINPSQGKIVRTCIPPPTHPRNHHIWNLQRLVLLSICMDTDDIIGLYFLQCKTQLPDSANY